jgi:hypothetical protein
LCLSAIYATGARILDDGAKTISAENHTFNVALRIGLSSTAMHSAKSPVPQL